MTAMEYSVQFIPFMLILFLVSLRYLGLFSALVFFSDTSMPIVVKFWLALILSLASVSAFGSAQVEMSLIMTVAGLILSCTRELFVGIVLGVIASSPLYAIHMAGRFIGQQMGFAMAEIMDPLSEQRVAIIGQLKYVLGTWFWFYLGGHLIMTQAVVESLRILPVGTPLLSYLSVESISAWVTGLFVIALKVVIPYFGVLLLAEIGLGFMARMVPQMNIFMLGFPIKILLALFLLTFLAVPMIKHILPYSIEKFLEMVPLFIGR